MESFFIPVTWHYDVIYVWLGYHSLRNNKRKFYSGSDYSQFESDLKKTVIYLRRYSKTIILCSALYPVEKKQDPNMFDILLFHFKPLCRLIKERILTDEAAVIEKKNNIISNISAEYGLVYCDINKYMSLLCEKFNTRCVHFDKIHYEGRAFPLQAKYLLKCARL